MKPYMPGPRVLGRGSVLGVLAGVLYASAAGAQTIRPLIAEFQREARGRVELVNDSDRPLNVIVEPRGFSVDDKGEMQDEPLPSHVHVKLSAMSFRLPPRQSRFVFYEATTDRAPAWFVLYANLTGFPTRGVTNLNVQLELPHIVYILPRDQWKNGDLRVRDIDVRRETGTLLLTVENNGQAFGRIAGLRVQGARQRVNVPGFPLFPGGRRRIEIEWKPDDEPETAVVDARSFSFEQKLNGLSQ